MNLLHLLHLREILPKIRKSQFLKLQFYCENFQQAVFEIDFYCCYVRGKCVYVQS